MNVHDLSLDILNNYEQKELYQMSTALSFVVENKLKKEGIVSNKPKYTVFYRTFKEIIDEIDGDGLQGIAYSVGFIEKMSGFSDVNFNLNLLCQLMYVLKYEGNF